MAPRANWKGFLRLSLVTCPVALYPATSESEKISFNQINRQTGHRIKYMKVDADTGEEVANEDIVKGYALDKDTFVEVTKEELENVAQESSGKGRGHRLLTCRKLVEEATRQAHDDVPS
jgi:DNA end-binding protein Ku